MDPTAAREAALIRMRDALHERGIPADEIDDAEVEGAYYRAEIRGMSPSLRRRSVDLSGRAYVFGPSPNHRLWIIWRREPSDDGTRSRARWLCSDGSWRAPGVSCPIHGRRGGCGYYRDADGAIAALERAGIL